MIEADHSKKGVKCALPKINMEVSNCINRTRVHFIIINKGPMALYLTK
jgi:hypothetical protein